MWMDFLRPVVGGPVTQAIIFWCPIMLTYQMTYRNVDRNSSFKFVSLKFDQSYAFL